MITFKPHKIIFIAPFAREASVETVNATDFRHARNIICTQYGTRTEFPGADGNPKPRKRELITKGGLANLRRTKAQAVANIWADITI